MTMSDDRPARYVEDGNVIYRASAVGGCIRSMVAMARGIKPTPHPEWFQEVLDEGTNAEKRIMELAGNYRSGNGAPQGIALDGRFGAQREVELLVGHIDGKNVIIRGHTDGIGIMPGMGEQYVVEAKKFRPSTYGKASREGAAYTEYYSWQLSIYMLATGLNGLWVAGLFDPNVKTVNQVKCHVYVRPIVDLATIKQKVAKVERLINEGYGPDEVECSGNYPCGFWFLHDGKEEAVAWELDTDDPEVCDVVRRYLDVEDALKTEKSIVTRLENEKKELVKQLRKVIAATNAPTDAKKFTAELDGMKVFFTRVVKEYPEATRTIKAYTQDYFTVRVEERDE